MKFTALALATVVISGMAPAAQADASRDAIIAALASEAKQANPAFSGFSAKTGEGFWHAQQSGGSAEATSCTACHTKDARAQGQTRAGKAIEPMAVSVNPQRFTDPAKVAKWFSRNCGTVLGRECTAEEKGNILTYLSSL